MPVNTPGFKLDQPTSEAMLEIIDQALKSGDLTIAGSATQLVDNLVSNSTIAALRADQGPAITSLITNAQTAADSAGTAAADAHTAANNATTLVSSKYAKPSSGIPFSDLEQYTTTPLTGSRPLTLLDHGKVFEVSNGLALTIPVGLPTTFKTTFLLLSGGSIGFIPNGGATLNGGTATLNRAATGDTKVELISLSTANSFDLTGGISVAGGGTNATNLVSNPTTTTVDILSDTGSDVTLLSATPALAGVMSAADKTKLNGIATGATINSTDAQLRDRSTHTGTQSHTTITGLNTTYASIAQGTTADAAALRLSRLPVSVLDYGADPTGVALANTAFTNALAASKAPYVPAGTYYLDNLNISTFGVKFWGPGVIKTSSGRLLNLSTIPLEQQEDTRIMFIEGNKPSFEELLDIKSLGYTAVMGYPWNFTVNQLILNAEAVGLKVLVHGGLGNTVPGTVIPATTYDSRDSVMGYYVLDEPVMNSISVADQERAITAYRAVTNKPLFCAENAVMYTNKLISSKWDVILADVYYANSHTSANEPLTQMIRNIAEFRLHAPNTQVWPCAGLFNDSGFTKSTTLTTKLAAECIRFSPDGAFAVFCWDAGITAGAYAGVRNTAAYYTNAQQLSKLAPAIQPYKVELVPIGGNLNNKLYATYKNTVDSATPGIAGTPTVLPWEVQNVGVITDARNSSFAASGLMVTGIGGTCGFSGMPAGICASVFFFNNYGTGATCTVELGFSYLGGYNFVSTAATSAISSGNGAPISKQLNANMHVLPMLKATLSSTTPVPYAFLNGYMAFSTVPEVSF